MSDCSQLTSLPPKQTKPAIKLDDNVFSWTSSLGFGFLTVNSVLAIHRAAGDNKAVVFVAASYLDLVLLFWSLRQFERAAPGSPKRERTKIAVWLLSTLLTVMFSSKVAALMPPPVAVAVWLMAAATCAGGFYGFFVCRDK